MPLCYFIAMDNTKNIIFTHDENGLPVPLNSFLSSKANYSHHERRSTAQLIEETRNSCQQQDKTKRSWLSRLLFKYNLEQEDGKFSSYNRLTSFGVATFCALVCVMAVATAPLVVGLTLAAPPIATVLAAVFTTFLSSYILTKTISAISNRLKPGYAEHKKDQALRLRMLNHAIEGEELRLQQELAPHLPELKARNAKANEMRREAKKQLDSMLKLAEAVRNGKADIGTAIDTPTAATAKTEAATPIATAAETISIAPRVTPRALRNPDILQA